MGRTERPTYGAAPRVALWAGILLTLIGLVSRYLIGAREFSSVTPLLFGMPIALLGVVALEPQYARRAMQSLLVLSLLGVLATSYVLPLFRDALQGQPLRGNVAVVLANGVTLLLCGLLLVVSFVALLRAWWKRARR
ncbi:MAG: hypothetical protein RMK84_15285 [Oscillochloridaceae bacterium]|nr:hypothetical protein [Chloroflexaceae bacterium]MDW8391487.1 hypothetical protein [Oscillochloridaceae bacterium]